MLVPIFRDKEGLLDVDAPKKCPLRLLRIKILLTARATTRFRSMNGRNHGLGVVWVQIRPPVPRTSGIGANRVYTRERHAATTGALASSSAIAGILKPAEQWAEGDKTAGCDTEAGLDVRPDGDVGGCVCGCEELLDRPPEIELLLGKLTQKVRILIVMKIRNADNDRSARNTAHAQNTSQCSFCSYVHLEIPDKEDGQKSQG